jgi:CXXC-20-CXXC protein
MKMKKQNVIGGVVLRKCDSCKMQFNRSKIYKSFGWTYKPIKCDFCNMEHRITFPGRLTFVSLTILPMLIFNLFLSPFRNIYVTLGIGLTIFLIGSLFVPYLVKFKKVS